MAVSDPVPWTYTIGGEVVEELAWLTDALPAITADEQRRRLRIAPRTRFEFDGLESGQRRRRMENALHANGAAAWQFPLTHDTVYLTAPLAPASSTILVSTAGMRFADGGAALLIGSDPTVHEVVVIDTVAVDSIDLAAGTVQAWPAGTRVIPLYAARFPSMPAISRFTGEDAPLRLQMLLTDPVDWPEDVGSAIYRSQPVLEWRPDWSSDPDYLPDRQVDVVDNDTAPAAVFDFAAMPLVRQTMQYLLVTSEKIGSFRSLLYGLAGRWASIWVPTWAHDFRLSLDAASTDSEIYVEASGFSDWPLAVNRKDIRIELLDGTVLYRRIVDADVVSDQMESLTLDSALGVDVDVADVAVISFLALCRQESDTNVLRWWDAGVAQSELTFRGFRHDL